MIVVELFNRLMFYTYLIFYRPLSGYLVRPYRIYKNCHTYLHRPRSRHFRRQKKSEAGRWLVPARSSVLYRVRKWNVLNRNSKCCVVTRILRFWLIPTWWMKASWTIVSLLSASTETRTYQYVLQRHARTVYKTKDEIPTRASLPFIVTYGIIFHTYYDHYYYTFSHSLHVLQVNDFNKSVGSKRAP